VNSPDERRQGATQEPRDCGNRTGVLGQGKGPQAANLTVVSARVHRSLAIAAPGDHLPRFGSVEDTLGEHCYLSQSELIDSN
jgi:hypothetical protein